MNYTIGNLGLIESSDFNAILSNYNEAGKRLKIRTGRIWNVFCPEAGMRISFDMNYRPFIGVTVGKNQDIKVAREYLNENLPLFRTFSHFLKENCDHPEIRGAVYGGGRFFLRFDTLSTKRGSFPKSQPLAKWKVRNVESCVSFAKKQFRPEASQKVMSSLRQRPFSALAG